MKRHVCAVLATALLSGIAVAGEPALPYTLPATLESGRFFVTPATAENGTKIRLFTDTGGGFFLGESSARALGAELDETKLTAPPSDGAEPQMVPWPAWSESAWIPAARSRPPLAPVMRTPPHMEDLAGGMLGGPWFGGRCWEFDYAAGTLRLLPDGALPKVADAHRIPLGFQKDAAGKHTAHFPRIAVRIDGEVIDLLFDTGASTRLTPETLKAIDDGQAASRATGFIIASVAKRWRAAHPDWPSIEAAETGTGAAMLQVPSIDVAGYSTGPVWFTVRPDPNFHEYMSQWMDRRVDGALGGNALAGFRVTVDYPSETATFERP